MVTFAGTVVIIGAVVSFTVTVNDFVTEFPRLSVAVTFTVVTPTGNSEPDGTEYTTDRTPLTASDAVAVPNVTGVIGPVASTVTLAGTVNDGGVVSCTVTLNVFVAVLPWVSVAVTVTVVVPIANVEPEAIDTETVGVPVASVALGEYVTFAPAELVASTVTSGAVIVGGV